MHVTIRMYHIASGYNNVCKGVLSLYGPSDYLAQAPRMFTIHEEYIGISRNVCIYIYHMPRVCACAVCKAIHVRMQAVGLWHKSGHHCDSRPYIHRERGGFTDTSGALRIVYIYIYVCM